MKTLIKGARVWQKDRSWKSDCPIVIEDGKILSVGMAEQWDEEIHAQGLTVLPGLVDVHTHGRSGYDFCDATREQMMQMKKDYLKKGVTSVFATLASGTEAQWNRAIENIEACGFAGIHLEGNYLNAAKRGAHAPELLMRPNAESLERTLKSIHLPCHISAAFELDSDGSFAACAKKYGATMGLGHTAATAAEAQLAIERGVTSFTHLYNCMPPLHHREGGAVCVGLTSNAWVELIADGLHICPEMICLAYRAKGNEKFVLITDSMSATGEADGTYAIAGMKVIVKDGRAETVEGALAGSTLELWNGVKNLMRFADIPLEDAVACATLNPARMVGIDHLVGSVEVGKRADLLLVNDALDVCMVFAAGERAV